MIILTPMIKEFEIARERFNGPDLEVILAGVGPRNMLRTLSQMNVSRNTPIMVFGFAGSNSLKIGTETYASRSFLYQRIGNYPDDPVELKRPDLAGAPKLGVPCYSSTDFVTVSNSEEPAIYDMELGFLTSFYTQISAWRIVTDNLSMAEFDNYLGR